VWLLGSGSGCAHVGLRVCVGVSVGISDGGSFQVWVSLCWGREWRGGM
jgi:hypothetical protein